MSQKKATIHDIARSLNLNASTVSRALQDHPRISEATKKLVREQAMALNYQPNLLASSLRKGQANTIGIVIPRVNRNFFANVIHGIESVAYAGGYHLLICQSVESLEKERDSVDTLINNRVDGIIISISAETENCDHIQRIVDAGIPLVQFDRVCKEVPSGQVVNDDVSTGREIIDHLVSQGYRRIAYLGGPQYLNVYRNRYTGYAEGLKAHGLPVHKEWASFDAMTQERGAAVVREWFSQQGEKPDAIYAAGDFSALGALLTLQELGIKVPEEVGVSGYANEQFTSLIQPGLTSADQFSVEMGKAAADLLIKAMQGKNDGECETRSIRPRLHIRGSTLRRGMEVPGSNGVEAAEK